MAGTKTDGDWARKPVQHAQDHFVQHAGFLSRRDAVHHFAKDDSLNPFKFSRKDQLPQQSIQLIGLHIAVLQKEQFAFGPRRIRSSQRRSQESKTAAIEDSAGLSRLQYTEPRGFSYEPSLPTQCGQ